MAKRVLCPECQAKNKLSAKWCRQCGIVLRYELRKRLPEPPTIIDIGPSLLERTSKAATVAVVGGYLSVFIIEDMTQHAPFETVNGRLLLEVGALIEFMQGVLAVGAGLGYFLLFVTVPLLISESKWLYRFETLRPLPPYATAQSGQALYDFYLTLGPENGEKRCAISGCHHQTLVHCDYCKLHWFARLKGETAVFTLLDYKRAIESRIRGG